MSYSVSAYAKLNLFLHITGKRDDGYHNIQSVFYRIDLADRLFFKLQQTAPTLIYLDDPKGITAPCDNLITKAAHLLATFARNNQALCPNAGITPVHIHLQKHIPTGAGLGGGSSNAAATLHALNKLWRLNLPTSTLQTLALKLGADVPFFVADISAAIACGIGERLTPISLPKTRFLLLSPDIHHATQAFFAHPALVKDTPVIDCICPQDFLFYQNPPYHNAFEPIALESTKVAQAMTYLQQLSIHATPRLTGTGSTVFLPIPETISDDTLAHWQKNAPFACHIVSGI